MPATRSHGMDQPFYPWSPIVSRPPLRWPDNARVAHTLAFEGLDGSDRGIRGIAIVCATAAVEFAVFVLRGPRS